MNTILSRSSSPNLTERSWTLPLVAPDAERLDVTGGKGMALARMASAGLPVPEGFHITTDAYRQFVTTNGLQGHILTAVAQIDQANPATLDAAEAAIRPLFAAGEMPAPLARAISRAYASLAAQNEPVAVRSSATAEDLPGASFAGQQESYLNVCGLDALLEKIRACWSSLWTARAIGYRARQGIDPAAVSMAVVVQRLIPAEASGVLFTANPLNGRRDQLLINATWGLGEALVGGQVTPDQWLVERATNTVLEETIAVKRTMSVRTAAGTALEPIPNERQAQPSLSPSRLQELCGLAERLDTFFGLPQDVEWALADKKLFILQSRPITGLFPLPEPLPTPEEGLRIYMCLNVVAQGITEPLTPMGLEMFRLLYVGMTTAATGRHSDKYPRWVKLAAGRMYLDMTALLRNPARWATIAGNLGRKDPVAGQLLHELLPRHTAEITGRPGMRLPWRLVLKIFPRLLLNALMGYLRPRRAREKMLRMGDDFLVRLQNQAQACRTLEDRIALVEQGGEQLFWQLIYEVAYCSAGIRLVENGPQLVERWLGDGARFHPVAQAIPHNPTTEMGLELLQIAATLAPSGKRASADHPLVQAFLAQYGHRAVREIDMGLPRWKDKPDYIVDLINSYIDQQAAEQKLQEFALAEQRAEAARAAIVADIKQRKGGLQARLANHLLGTARELAGLRERPKFDLVRSLALFHQEMQKVGAELAANGRLEQPDDVFFVTFAALKSGADLRPLAAAQRASYTQELQRRHVPRIMSSLGECLYGSPQKTADGALVGTPVSPGRVSGSIRVMHEPQGASLQAGEILVTHSTDPGWTPLFLNAGGLIMETGGPISHGAIVAREYGIPAVAGVAEATTQLKTGDQVTVDGELGTVEIIG